MTECDRGPSTQAERLEAQPLGTVSTKLAHKCNKCQKLIAVGVEYHNQVWHRECLTCNNCARQLAGTRFTNINGLTYCFHCFGLLFAHKCTACSQPIYGLGDGFLVYMEERRWHVDCFRCISCGVALLGEITYSDAKGVKCHMCADRD